MTSVIIANSVTKPTEDWKGAVLIAGSHGGTYAAHCALKAGVRGVILNDAGIGKDEAGVSGGKLCEQFGVPYAALDTRSGKIGDGEDMAENGLVSFRNDIAGMLGIKVGMTAKEAAELMKSAAIKTVTLDAFEEARTVEELPHGLRLVLIDSASLVKPEDAGQIIITGSHGGLMGGDPAGALRVDALICAFNDAGKTKEGAGLTRLPALQGRGVAACTVAAKSARIGDARSSLEDGVISHFNEAAEKLGASKGKSLKELISNVGT